MGISREAAFNQLRHTRRAVPVIVETDLCVCVCVCVCARARAREGERERGEGERETEREREREKQNMLCTPVLPESSVEGSFGRRRSLHREFCSGKAPIA